MRKTTLSPQSLLPEWFSIKLLVNSDIFKLSLNLSFTHLRALSSCYELRGGLSPVILKEIFHDSLKISKFSKICIENHSRADWVAKVVFGSDKSFQFSAADAIAAFEIYV